MDILYIIHQAISDIIYLCFRVLTLLVFNVWDGGEGYGGGYFLEADYTVEYKQRMLGLGQ